MRLAADIVSARDRSAARHKLVTENFVRNPDVYASYLNVGTGDINYPLEDLNERERILEGDLLPVGDIQEYLQDALGITMDDKRLITTDLWWKDVTDDLTTPEEDGEDRIFQYAAASSDAVKINELMVRPVRRVEAETQSNNITQPDYWDYAAIDSDASRAFNLNPAPHTGMLPFDVSTPMPLIVNSLLPDTSGSPVPAWQLRSAYDYDSDPDPSVTNLVSQPMLGESTSWVYAPLNTGIGQAGPAFPNSWVQADLGDPDTLVNPDILEFRFRASEGLPPGRYYLTVNVTDQYGNMSVQNTDILEYSIKYSNPNPVNPVDFVPTITQDTQNLLGLMLSAPNNAIAKEYADFINGLWQRVDAPEYIASPAANNLGAATPPGWLFLPVRPPVDPGQVGMWAHFTELRDLISAFDQCLTSMGVSNSSRFTKSWPWIITDYYAQWLQETIPVSCLPPQGLLFEHLGDVLGIPFIDVTDPVLCADELWWAVDVDGVPIEDVWNAITAYLDPAVLNCYTTDPTAFTPDWYLRLSGNERFLRFKQVQSLFHG